MAADSPGPSTLSTLDLVKSAQGGDALALDHLFRRYRSRLRRWAAGRIPPGVRGRMDTEDVVHDVLRNTFQRLDQLEPRQGGFFQAYLRQAVLHAIRDQAVKKREVHPPTSLMEQHPEPEPSPLEAMIGKNVFARYEKALVGLDPQEREAVVARLEDRASWEEIATDLGKSSPDAARMMVKRALLKVALEMG